MGWQWGARSVAPRLYPQAAANQWDPATALEWDAAFDLPADIEAAVVQVMTYLVENKQVAMIVPARFLGRIHPHFREVLQVLAVQAADEARHTDVFARRATLRGHQLGVSGAGGRASLTTLLEEPDFALASFLLSVLGLGQRVITGMRQWLAHHHVLAWMCVLIAVNQLGFGAVVPVLPLYASTFGVSVAAIGLTIGIYGLARFVLSLPAGRSADRIGRRPTLALGGVLTVVGSLASAIAPNYEWFLLARFTAGAGAALTLTAAQIILADITVPADRGRAMGLYSGFFAFAVGLGPFPGGVLADEYGLAAPFLACAVLAFLFTVLGWLFVPETARARVARTTHTSSAGLSSFDLQLRLLATNRSFLLISLVGFSSAVARTGALFSVVPLLMRDRLALSPDQIGLGLSLVSLGALCLAYPSGVLVDRFGRKAVISPGVLIAGLAGFTFAFAPTFAWYLAACGVWSVALGVSAAAPSAYAADIAPPGMNAAVLSSFRMLSDAGYMLGPIVLGLVAERFGATSALTSAGSLLVVSAIVFALLAPETYHPSLRS